MNMKIIIHPTSKLQLLLFYYIVVQKNNLHTWEQIYETVRSCFVFHLNSIFHVTILNSIIIKSWHSTRNSQLLGCQVLSSYCKMALIIIFVRKPLSESDLLLGQTSQKWNRLFSMKVSTRLPSQPHFFKGLSCCKPPILQVVVQNKICLFQGSALLSLRFWLLTRLNIFLQCHLCHIFKKCTLSLDSVLKCTPCSLLQGQLRWGSCCQLP